MDPVPEPPPLRRTPVQRRSAERLTRILDACAQLLEEAGYEELSTRDVAVRAGVPIGSVYRFFSNKRAMAAALAHRNLDRYAERVAARLAGPPRGPVVDVVLDEYLAMKRTVPGFGLVDFGVPVSAADPGEGSAGGPDGAADHLVNHLVADRICGLLAAHLGRTADATLRRKVLVAVEATDALLQLAFRAGPPGDQELIDETRALLRAYLAPVLPD
ncbi:TetR/AcrR family transcriptional regulator [Streptomyces sp. WAC05374]|uniref:TetR/AcrR family transcriptional regulator n=1 Tax=Streptomyces sp. WAC05374 TaxID=2487420 RepID=UPI000F891C08|nr:TetR/AcrR family transcriptional regulator [Streptomyces sp. WAC05374]RST06047.1 TetR/AcrR family transcriptional regulator [Streptomyces sp. WAC05374]TDF40762.1 TetR/AcrR family transcriptional regulator [Streptomyces sp. WAC05374]TDF49501.1 TetR/AcrR family transcriptional regulator [Streptomyces sp. WAC05374]TDF49978.1 TetR/AcrR family transcriptional regulator [Streptomyces sp. WAC05374]